MLEGEAVRVAGCAGSGVASSMTIGDVMADVAAGLVDALAHPTDAIATRAARIHEPLANTPFFMMSSPSSAVAAFSRKRT